MENIVTILEIIGAIAFAVSGTLVGIRKNMDVFGVCVLGLSTAVGGGLLRDVMASAPPYIFTKHEHYTGKSRIDVRPYQSYNNTRTLYFDRHQSIPCCIVS